MDDNGSAGIRRTNYSRIISASPPNVNCSPLRYPSIPTGRYCYIRSYALSIGLPIVIVRESTPAMNSLPPPGIRLKSTYGFTGLRFEEVDYASGLRYPSHTHKDVFFDLCLQGTIQEFGEKQCLIRGPSSVNFVPAGTPHGNHFREDTRCFQIVLTPLWLERIQPYCVPLTAPAIYQGGIPTWILTRLYREYQNRDTASPLMLEGLLLELLAEIARQSSLPADTSCPRWLRHAEEYLRNHFTETLSLEALAKTVGVHPSHLMRTFRQQYHCTIGDFVRRLKVEYACHLLTAADVPSAQIAILAGFADQSHFNRTFKVCTGMTPTDFQKMTGRATLKQPGIV